MVILYQDIELVLAKEDDLETSAQILGIIQGSELRKIFPIPIPQKTGLYLLWPPDGEPTSREFLSSQIISDLMNKRSGT